MTRCPRCGGSVLVEHFAEDRGHGCRWTCISCGEDRERMDDEIPFTMTPEELADLATKPRRGRPRRVR